MGSLQDILKMSDSQWEAYRKQMWENAKSKYSTEVPKFFMPNKDKYVDFLKKQKQINLSKKIPFNINIEEIEKMSTSQWNAFRTKKWEEKGKKYVGNEIPDWYLKKDQYIAFLKKNTK